MSFKSPPGISIGENMDYSATNTANKHAIENNAKKANDAKDQPSFLDQLVESANTDLKLAAAANVQINDKNKKRDKGNELDYLFGECDQDEPMR